MGPGMHRGWDGWDAWTWIVGWHVLWWVVLAASVAGIVVLVSRRAADGGGTGPDPMRILEERYARGEIDTDEFERRREVLR
jgi:putative membrane protein